MRRRKRVRRERSASRSGSLTLFNPPNLHESPSQSLHLTPRVVTVAAVRATPALREGKVSVQVSEPDIIRTVWSRLVEMLGRGYAKKPAAAAARSAFESTYPELEATDVWLRAHEASRDVVAVLYQERENKMIPCGMPRYKLFAVRAADLVTEELAVESGSPYAIRGIK